MKATSTVEHHCKSTNAEQATEKRLPSKTSQSSEEALLGVVQSLSQQLEHAETQRVGLQARCDEMEHYIEECAQQKVEELLVRSEMEHQLSQLRQASHQTNPPVNLSLIAEFTSSVGKKLVGRNFLGKNTSIDGDGQPIDEEWLQQQLRVQVQCNHALRMALQDAAKTQAEAVRKARQEEASFMQEKLDDLHKDVLAAFGNQEEEAHAAMQIQKAASEQAVKAARSALLSTRGSLEEALRARAMHEQQSNQKMELLRQDFDRRLKEVSKELDLERDKLTDEKQASALLRNELEKERTVVQGLMRENQKDPNMLLSHFPLMQAKLDDLENKWTEEQAARASESEKHSRRERELQTQLKEFQRTSGEERRNQEIARQQLASLRHRESVLSNAVATSRASEAVLRAEVESLKAQFQSVIKSKKKGNNDLFVSQGKQQEEAESGGEQTGREGRRGDSQRSGISFSYCHCCTFEDGPLGLGLESSDDDYFAQVSYCTESTQASRHHKLRPGQALLAVGEESLLGMGFDAVLKKLRHAQRPMILRFGVPSDAADTLVPFRRPDESEIPAVQND